MNRYKLLFQRSGNVIIYWGENAKTALEYVDLESGPVTVYEKLEGRGHWKFCCAICEKPELGGQLEIDFRGRKIIQREIVK